LAKALRVAQAELARRLARIEGAEPVDVHQARVAARRLRSLLRTFKPLFAADPADRYRGALKQTADLLGDIRRLDVLAAMAPLRRQPFDHALRQDRVLAVRKLQRRLQAASVQKALASSLAAPALAGLGLAPGVDTETVLRRVRRCWRRVARRIDAEPDTSEARHRLRIELKHCRYSLEIISDIEPRRAGVLDARLRAAQQVLGDQRDLEAAREWLQSAGARALGAHAVARASVRMERRAARFEAELVQTLAQLRTAGGRWDEAVTGAIRRASPDRS
jgi:CHAD domain-containing protein